MAALGWLLNLGFAGSDPAVGAPTIPGPEYTVPPGRMHYTVPIVVAAIILLVESVCL